MNTESYVTKHQCKHYFSIDFEKRFNEFWNGLSKQDQDNLFDKSRKELEKYCRFVDDNGDRVYPE